MNQMKITRICATLTVIGFILTIGIGINSEVATASDGGSWTTKASMPTARMGAAAAVVDGKIYIIGGFKSGSGLLSSNEVYNPSTNSWEIKAPMPTPRAGLGVVAVNEKIYAIGGGREIIYDKDSALPYQNPSGIVEVYDTITDTWTSSYTPMPTPRFDFSLTVVDDKIYAIGYWDECEVYNPITDSWSEDPPMPTARIRCGAAVVNKKIYVIGGEESISGEGITNCECYDPFTKSWDILEFMPTRRCFLGVCSIDEKIYAIGGGDFDYRYGRWTGDHNQCEQYNPIKNSWASMTDMPSPRRGCVATSVDNKIYVIGGYYDGIFLTKNEEFTPPSAEINEMPSVSVTSPLENANLSGFTDILGTVSDNDGTVQSVQIRIDAGLWVTATGTTSWSYSWDTTTVNNGEHTVYARSFNGEDYSDLASVNVTVYNPTSGNQRPTLEISFPNEGDTINGSITVSGTASDVDGIVQRVEIKINSETWITAIGTTSWSYTWDTTVVNDGDHTIYARSYDGEDYSEVESLDIAVDNQEENKIPDGVDGIPGFELILVIIAIALVIFWKKQRKKQDE